MSQTTAACAASKLFNLPGFEVVDVCRDEAGGRVVTIRTTATAGWCPPCKVLSGSVHQWTRQRVRDVPFSGPIVVWWLRKRWRCVEQLCRRRSFTERTARVPSRARMTTRLAIRLLDAVTSGIRASRGSPPSTACRGRPSPACSRRQLGSSPRSRCARAGRSGSMSTGSARCAGSAQTALVAARRRTTSPYITNTPRSKSESRQRCRSHAL